MIKVLLISAALTAVSPAQEAPAPEDTVAVPVQLSLQDALKIALSESPSVKIADMEVKRVGYSRKGSYAALYPTIDGSASYQRTIKKQVMYMDSDGGFDISGMVSEALLPMLAPLYAKHPDITPPSPSPTPEGGGSSNDGIAVGRWNTFSAGISASMPLVNAQLWKSLKISDQDVELAVEKARSSRLETVNQVKQAYLLCLLSREALNVYRSVFDNAKSNLELIEKKFKAKKASELELTRAKTTLANAIPSVFDAENSLFISLWQLKAVMGVDLDMEIEVSGDLMDYSEHMLYDIEEASSAGLENNSTMRQLAIQAEQLANMVKMQQFANIPSLAVGFSYALNAMTNDFKFSEFKWSPYSYVGLSLQIPIFAGGKRNFAIKQAKVQAAELDLQKANTERQLKISIRQYLNSMENSMKSLASAESAVETARKAYSIAAKSYDVGRSTLTDLNDAQLALTQAQLTVAQAVYTFAAAKANLENVLGADFIDYDGNVELKKTYDRNE